MLPPDVFQYTRSAPLTNLPTFLPKALVLLSFYPIENVYVVFKLCLRTHTSLVSSRGSVKQALFLPLPDVIHRQIAMSLDKYVIVIHRQFAIGLDTYVIHRQFAIGLLHICSIQVQLQSNSDRRKSSSLFMTIRLSPSLIRTVGLLPNHSHSTELPFTEILRVRFLLLTYHNLN